MGIRKTYYDGNPEDRNWADDYWSWLKDQPQDAWLLWAREANWDNAESIFADMVRDERCDLALVSYLFWTAEPGFFVSNPYGIEDDTLIGTIIANVERSFYRHAALTLDRYSVVHNVHGYVTALRATAPRPAPFRLPRVLCGPFDGRPAQLPNKYDAQTERDLKEIFDAIDGWLPRSEAEYQQSEERGGNLWIKPHLRLPSPPADPLKAYAALNDAAYVEAIFGTSAEYSTARKAATAPLKRGWWPFS